MENSASNIPDTTWLLVFWPNGLNGTKFGWCFFIGLDLRDSFSRSLLGENGYFIVFWHFRPSFKLILHTSKWILCKQKFWELFISILGSLQHKFYGHLDCLNRKFIGGVTFTPPRACPMNRDPGLNRVNKLLILFIHLRDLFSTIRIWFVSPSFPILTNCDIFVILFELCN